MPLTLQGVKQALWLLFQLRPNMELYQRSMVNIMSPRASPEKLRGSISASPQASTNGNIPSSTTLTCPAETLQNPSYLMVTAPVEESMSAKQPKRPKEQEASKFIAGDDNRLIIGVLVKHTIDWPLKEPLIYCVTGKLRVLCSYLCVFFQVVMEVMLSACKETYKGVTQSRVKLLRALHSARETSRSSPWKCGASRTPFPFLIVFLLSELEKTALTIFGKDWKSFSFKAFGWFWLICSLQTFHTCPVKC